MTRTRQLAAVAAALLLTTAACGSDDPDLAQTGTTAPSSRPRADGAGVMIVAEDIAFDATELDASVGATVTIDFDNRDEGIAHNLHVESTSAGEAKTDIEEGPVTQTLEVTFDDAGEFAYLCDVHPQQMRGTITVAP